MNLETPQSVEKLQAALHAKAKGSPDYRFYLLYDKIYRRDILQHAYARCKANRGAPGIDEQEFADVEKYGLERWLDELAQSLRERTYRPDAVRRVHIPKPDDPGRLRPLGLPTIRDRVVQTAAVLVLAPIFEADLPPNQYAYRSGGSALDAVCHVQALLGQGYTQVVDADLSGYFDSIPHAELMKCLARRIVDRHVLHLIKMWLEMPVEETDHRGRRHRTTRNRDTGRGTPQGAPISPLLSNLYMRRFVVGWTRLGHAGRLGAEIVNYADDFVICCRGTAEQALAAMQGMMQRLKLTVNPAKTRVCSVLDGAFDFLGYSFGRMISPRTGGAYLGLQPAQKRVQRICRAVSDQTSRRWLCCDEKELVGLVNQRLEGWANYFCLGTVSRIYRAIDAHVRWRLRQWLSRKHKRSSRGGRAYPDAYLHGTLGLVRLGERRGSLPWATA